jgi:hypothetical protein
MQAKKLLGFGFSPEQSAHHFLVIIPRNKTEKLIVYERFFWDMDSAEQKINEGEDIAKVEISKEKWEKLQEYVKNEFNLRLKLNNLNTGSWKTGQNPVERLLGKELILLLWAIEDCEISQVETAAKNWLGLSPEERWWLFTMTNASTGELYDDKGWRKAIKYALTENPIIEKNKQESLFGFFKRNVTD